MSAPADTSVATIAPNATHSNGQVTGVKKGTTTYTYTTKNRLGDEVIVTGKITVLPYYVPTATIKKTLATESIDLSTGNFSFKVWPADDESAAETVTNAPLNQPKSLTKLEKGAKHYIAETNVPTGYEITGFTVTNNTQENIVVTDTGTTTAAGEKIFEFTIPQAATSVSITAINKNSTASLSLAKQLTTGSLNLQPDYKYPITVKQGSDTIITGDLKSTGTDKATSDQFIYTRKYTITETVPVGYAIDSVKIVNAAGTAVGTQPTKVTGSNDSYEFNFEKNHANGTIVVVNKLLYGNGLTLSKEIEDGKLKPDETFTFLLSGDNGYNAYGTVTGAGAVTWKDKATGGSTVNVGSLPYGKYTLTETSTNANYELEKFDYTAANSGVLETESDNTKAVFVVDEDNAQFKLKAVNKLKRTGSVAVTKNLDSTDFKTESIEFVLTHVGTNTVYKSEAVMTTDQQVFSTWKSGGTDHTSLPLGEYTLTETAGLSYFEFDKFQGEDIAKATSENGGKTLRFTLTNASNSFSVNADNKLKTGTINLTKQISGNMLGATSFDFTLYKYVEGKTPTQVATKTISFTGSETNQTKTESFTSIPYGRYYIEEKAHGSYKLDTSSSSVIQVGDTPVVDTNALLLNSQTLSFTAVNKLKSAPATLKVSKFAPDAGEVTTANTFSFGIYRGTQKLYEGTVLSTDSAIASSPGTQIVWTELVSGYAKLDATKTTLSEFEFGTYYVEETISGNDFRAVDVTSHPDGYGTASGKTKYTFTIDSTTNDGAIIFKNEHKFIHEATIEKDFAANSKNLRADKFSFKYWKDGETSKTNITDVDENTTAALILEKGVTYNISEDAKSGYILDSVAVKSGATVVPVTKQGENYQFTVPNDVNKITITATNSNDIYGMSLEKQLSANTLDLKPQQSYPIKISEQVTNHVVHDASLKSDGVTASLAELIHGKVYEISETVPEGYELVSVKIVDATGTPVATAKQPTKSGDKYIFTFDKAVHSDAKIIVTNKVKMGSGLKLTKALENHNLTKEEFEFVLTGDNNFKAIGTRLDKGAVTTWVDENDQPISVTTLPYGKYTLTETANNINFELDKIAVTSGGLVDSTASTASSLVFTVKDGTTDINVTATNKIIKAGTIKVFKNLDLSDFTGNTIEFTLTHVDSGTVYKSSALVTQNNQEFSKWKNQADDTIVPDGEMPLGKYTLTETKTGTHYDFDQFEQPVGDRYTLTNQGKTAEFTLSNEQGLGSFSITAYNKLKKGDIVITKNVPGDILGGSAAFEFDIYKYVDGASGDVLVATKSITVTDSTAKSITHSGVDYGRYYVREKQTDNYQLTTSSSSVIAHDATLNENTDVITLQTADITFNATNQLQTSEKALTINKKIDEGEIYSPAPVFKFEILDSFNRIIYTGEIPADTAGITGKNGAAITWTKSGTHNNGEISGSEIKNLAHGTYVVREKLENEAAVDYTASKVSGTNGFGTAQGATAYEFNINNTTAALAENAVLFENQRNFMESVTFTKSLAAGTTNPNGETFDLKFYPEGQPSKATTITGFKEGHSQTLKLEKGQTRYVFEETVPAVYRLGKVTVTQDAGTPVDLTPADNKVTIDILPATKNLTINFENEFATMPLIINKKVKDDVFGLFDGAAFPVTITEDGESTAQISGDLKVGTPIIPDASSQLVANKSYSFKEAVPAGFTLESVQFVNRATGNPLASGQPVVQPDGSYKFTMLQQQDNDLFDVLVTNTVLTGEGLSVTKLAEQTSLPSEEFLFELDGPFGLKLYGSIADSSTALSQSVKWYSDTARTTAVDITTLPQGDYTLTELKTNTNFELDGFAIIGGTNTSSANNKAKFTITDTSQAVKITATNKIKSNGTVTVNKHFTPFVDTNDTFEFTLTHSPSGKQYKSTKAVTASSTSPAVFNSWIAQDDPTQTPVTNLPLGNYTLTEADSSINYNWDRFDPQTGVDISGTKGEIAKFTLSAQSASSNSITIGAHNKLETGSVTITKSVLGGFAGLNSRDFKFNLFRKESGGAVQVDESGNVGSTPIVITVTASDVTAGSTLTKTINNLPYGEYYIEEHVDDAFELTDSSEATLPGNATPKKKTLNTAGITFSVTNKLKKADSNFAAYKKANTAEGIPVNNFAFELWDTDSNTLIYKGVQSSDAAGIQGGVKVKWTKEAGVTNGNLTSGDTEIEKLDFGNYLIKETSYGSDYEFTSVAGRGGLGSKQGDTGLKFAINAQALSGELVVDFTNTLKASGAVVVNKKFANNENPFPGTDFVYQLKNNDTAVIYTGTTNGTQPVAKWMQGTKEVSNGSLPYGTYTLTEKVDANYDLDTITSTDSNVTIAGSSAQIYIGSSSETAELTVTNKIKTTGSMDIVKTFEDGYNHDISSTFTFKVYGPEINGTMPSSPSHIVTVDNASGWKHKLDNLPFGKYKVVEDLTGMGDYEFVLASDGKNTVTSTDGTPVELNLLIGAKSGQQSAAKVATTNRVARIGSITITKHMEGKHAESLPTFDFKITNPDGTIRQIKAEKDVPVVIDGLILGSYKVEEIAHSDYELLGYGKKNNLDKAPQVVSLTLDNPEAKVDAYNRAKTDGTITFKPTMIDSIKSTTTTEKFDFELLWSLDGGTTWSAAPTNTRAFLSAGNKVTLDMDESYTFKGLTRGAMYKLRLTSQTGSRYNVVEIAQTAGSIQQSLEDLELTFTPSHANLSPSAKFLMDRKRTSIVIFKYNDRLKLGVSNAKFRLSQVDESGVETVIDNQNTTRDGNAVFSGLTEGKYILHEYKAPYYYKVQQARTYVEIKMNSSGDLYLEFYEPSRYVTLENGVLNIPNIFDPPETPEEGGKGGIDEDINLKPEDGGGTGGTGSGGTGGTGGTGSGDKTEEELMLEQLEPKLPTGAGNHLLEPSADEDRDSKGAIRLPNAGGVPLSYISFIGVAVLGAGYVLERKRKNRGKNEED